MAQEFPKMTDEVLNQTDAERSWFWCNMAMVSAEYQGHGIAMAMFDLAFEEVSPRIS